ncbi:MAG: hypothetical protein U0V70_22275, partial [Terriglobia bacterium]
MPPAEPVEPAAILEPKTVLSRLVRSRAWKLSFVGLLVALTIGTLVFWQVWRQTENQPEKLKEISIKPLTSYPWDSPVWPAAISADGNYLAFGLKGKLFIQIIASGGNRPIPLPEWFQPGGLSWFPDGTKLLLSR